MPEASRKNRGMQMRHYFSWGPLSSSPVGRARIQGLWDVSLQAMEPRLDGVARGIVTLASKEPRTSKWSPASIDHTLKLWGKTISEAKAPFEVLVFLKQRFARGDRAFW